MVQSSGRGAPVSGLLDTIKPTAPLPRKPPAGAPPLDKEIIVEQRI